VHCPAGRILAIVLPPTPAADRKHCDAFLFSTMTRLDLHC